MENSGGGDEEGGREYLQLRNPTMKNTKKKKERELDEVFVVLLSYKKQTQILVTLSRRLSL